MFQILKRCRSVSHSGRLLQSRRLSQHVSGYRRLLFRGDRALVSGGALLALGIGLYPLLSSSTIHADSAGQRQLPQIGLPSSSTKEHNSKEKEKARTPLGSLIRTYIVYSMCSVPGMIDAAPWILETLSSVPVLKQITEAFVRVTFFDQFVGGDSAKETLPLLRSLRSSNRGVLFAYSVEVDEHAATAHSSKHGLHQPPYKRAINEMMHCIDVAGDFEDHLKEGQGRATTANGRKSWVAVKLTALLPDANSLIRLSSNIVSAHKLSSASHVPFPGSPLSSDLDLLYPSATSALDTPATNKGSELLDPSLTQLTEKDIHSLRELHTDLFRVCARAKERGVKVIIDAEYSWYQPAVDALTLSLMKEFNKIENKSGAGEAEVNPLIYNSFQAYLRRTPSHLAHSLAHAQKHNYALGIKLVRGAYHPHELEAYHALYPPSSNGRKSSLCISLDNVPPVWEKKEETDRCYNDSVEVLLNTIQKDVEDQESGKGGGPRIGALLGTHNWDSCGKILNGLVDRGLASEVRDGDETVLRLSDAVTDRLSVAQLYGMSDNLSTHLVSHTASSTPFILKYVPYGALADVMPYLSRRAIENKSVLGNGTAEEERRIAGREIRRRVFGF